MNRRSRKKAGGNSGNRQQEDSYIYLKLKQYNMVEGALPIFKAMNPELALEDMSTLIAEIESGEFKVVALENRVQNEVSILPNPGGKHSPNQPGRQ